MTNIRVKLGSAFGQKQPVAQVVFLAVKLECSTLDAAVGSPMPDSLVLFLGICPALVVFIGYLYAAGRLDRLVHTRYPVEWEQIIGETVAHSSSNAIRLMRKGEMLRSLNDVEITKSLVILRYLFWAFALSLIYAFLFA
jgi:hypothetical protein